MKKTCRSRCLTTTSWKMKKKPTTKKYNNNLPENAIYIIMYRDRYRLPSATCDFIIHPNRKYDI